MKSTLSLPAVAAHFGVPAWTVRKLLERGIIAEPERVGRCRVFRPRDLPRIGRALRACGYLEVAVAT